MNKKYNTEIFIEKAKIVHGNKYDYSKVVYIKSNEKVLIVCGLHGKFYQNPASHLTGSGCGKCSTIRTHEIKIKPNEIFIKECIEKFGVERFDYSLTNYTGAHKKITVICKKHGQFNVVARSHYKNNGCCNKCRNEKLYNLFSGNKEDFILKSKQIHNDLYDYKKVLYYNAENKVKIKCIYHNQYFLVSPNNHLRGKGCPKCKSSKGEIAIRNFLKENNIKSKEQKKFDDCKYINKLSFDFYLEKYNLLIEYQGEQHYIYSNIFHKSNRKSLKIQQIIDEIKRQFAKDNNIKLLEIPYWEKDNIKSILIKELNIES